MKGTDMVTAYDGSQIYARDWVPYMRVMPHAEYPSGSGCICTGVAQFVDEFVSFAFGDDSFATTWEFMAGSNKVDAGTPASDVTFTFENMMELKDMCGESRLWGGMHFQASVPDSYTLCDGVGNKGLTDLMTPLLGSTAFSDLMDPEAVELFGSSSENAGGGKGGKSGKSGGKGGKGKRKLRSRQTNNQQSIPKKFRGTTASSLKKSVGIKLEKK